MSPETGACSSLRDFLFTVSSDDCIWEKVMGLMAIFDATESLLQSACMLLANVPLVVLSYLFLH